MKATGSFFLVILVMILPVQGQLKTGFYSSSCPKAEATIRSTVESYFNKDPTIVAGLLRLHFHDCFVQGCDGSVLLVFMFHRLVFTLNKKFGKIPLNRCPKKQLRRLFVLTQLEQRHLSEEAITTDMKATGSFFLVILVMILPVQGQLKTGFYSSSCPKAEATIRSTVESYFNKDPTIVAGLLRLHFHDCFVQGCDGSVLLVFMFHRLVFTLNKKFGKIPLNRCPKKQLRRLFVLTQLEQRHLVLFSISLLRVYGCHYRAFP
ncbi:hypothetical protein L3X38_040298 [Prunus dulcis]|uniref:peroxidase n=1 Tax=Prunus dulcis TaxID=3755 RepID=A0AAD4YT99_PRUDU|nr:hypothetical protein L3X38_040298 [Prunus dulcis]